MKNNIDILNGKLSSSLIRFAIPIALSSIMQQLFNAADTTVVGQFAGSNALAAVGTNSELVALIVTISAGLAVGTNVLIAKYIGTGDKNKISESVYSSIFLAIIIGFIGLLAGLIFSDDILKIINAPSAVFSEASAYLKIYFIGYPFIVIYDFCSATFRSKGDSRSPFIVLVISGFINVILNLMFVILFKQGVTGVAVATDLANLFSCVTMLILTFKDDKYSKLSIKNFKISFNAIKSILAIGVPSAVQGAVFCFANLFITASVNEFGEIATAGNTISINYEYFTFYIVTAFGQAATTFISQNYSAGNMERCSEIMKKCILFGIVFTAILSVPVTVFNNFSASIFSHDPAVIDAAAYRIRIVIAIVPFCAFYEVLADCLRGRGYSLQPAIAMMCGICGVRIIWIFTVFRHVHTLTSLFVIFPISWITTTILMVITYSIIIRNDKKQIEYKKKKSTV